METKEENEIINEALQIIDKTLAEIVGREIVSSSEISDVLLDVRQLIAKESN